MNPANCLIIGRSFGGGSCGDIGASTSCVASPRGGGGGGNASGVASARGVPPTRGINASMVPYTLTRDKPGLCNCLEFLNAVDILAIRSRRGRGASRGPGARTRARSYLWGGYQSPTHRTTCGTVHGTLVNFIVWDEIQFKDPDISNIFLI